MTVYNNPSKETWKQLCERPQLNSDLLESTVKNILMCVKNSGDAAVALFTKQFDSVTLTNLQVTKAEMRDAIRSMPKDLKNSIQQAALNIQKFHKGQVKKERKIATMPGVVCWRKAVPITKVGLYIPGGSAPLFSTVLMLGVPAALAGCEEIILCTPPNHEGQIAPAILYAASLSGITKIFKVGGAQAIAAMAYGTESIPQVYKIFGPGNQFVTKAKQLVNNEGIAIDLPAGPSEVLVLADESANVSFIAADLLSQAEHGEDSQVMLVVTQKSLLKKVQEEVQQQMVTLPRRGIAEKALMSSRALCFNSMKTAIDFVNEYATEHLVINTKSDEAVAEKIINAGSVFIGKYSPEAAGDYASGTNHTLPTNGYAKASSGVSLESFMKYITFQKLTKAGIKKLGPVIERMADAEGLEAHKRAVRVRLRSLKN